MTDEGWARYGNSSKKVQYFKKDSAGLFLSACNEFGRISIGEEEFVDDPPQERKCKKCLNAMEELR
jgi:hypothetical protein